MNGNSYIFIQENTFEKIVWKMLAILSQPQCDNWPGLSVIIWILWGIIEQSWDNWYMNVFHRSNIFLFMLSKQPILLLTYLLKFYSRYLRIIGFGDYTDLLWLNNINNYFCQLTSKVWDRRTLQMCWKSHLLGTKNNWGVQSKNGLQNLWENIVFFILC